MSFSSNIGVSVDPERGKPTANETGHATPELLDEHRYRSSHAIVIDNSDIKLVR